MGQERLWRRHVRWVLGVTGRQKHAQYARPDDLLRFFRLTALQYADFVAPGLIVGDTGDRRQRFGLPFLCRPQLVRELLALFAFRVVERVAQPLDLGLNFVVLGVPALYGFRLAELLVVFLRRGQKRLQTVIIALPNGIEHVIVAAGAAHGQAEVHRAD